MQISSFKLIDSGYTGISVTAKESIPQGNMTLIDEVTRKRLYPLNDEVINAVQKLKYFFLNLTGHWIEVFNKSFDLQTYEVIHPEPGTEPLKSFILLQSLLNHTTITGVVMKNAGFCITGKIETVEGKKMGLSTPFVTEEDDLGFFIEATTKINNVLDEIAGVLKSSKAVEFNAKEVIAHKGLKPNNLDEMQQKEMVEIVLNRLNDIGVVVLQNDIKSISGSKDKLHTGTGSIDSHNMPDAVEHIEEDEQIIITDKKPIGKGSLASEKKFPRVGDDGKVTRQQINESDIPEGGSLEHLEFSENLGMQRDNIENTSSEEESIQDTKTEW